jgi:FkbM family methyltransferase
MRCPAELVARAYLRGLLPGRIASPLFWRLAPRDQRINEVVVDADVTVGGRTLRLELALKSVVNWTLLFDAVHRSADAPLLGEFDRLVADARCVLDIGSNVGLYTYHAAVHAPPDAVVVGVEANGDLAEATNRNLQANHLDGARVVCAAITDHVGEVTLHVGRLDLVSSLDAGHVDSYGGSSGQVVVPGTTLDALVADLGLRPDVVKIDVEGSELAALQGGEKTLLEFHPAILVEVKPETAEPVHELLADAGYRGRRFNATGLEPIGARLVPEGHAYANLLYLTG